MTSTTSRANRLYQLAARSYPTDYRSERGEEIVATALELNDNRFSLREAGALFAGGLRARAQAGLAGDGGSVLVSGLRVGIFLLLLDALLQNLLTVRYDAVGPGWPGMMIGAVGTMLMLVSTGRLAAAAQTVLLALG